MTTIRINNKEYNYAGEVSSPACGGKTYMIWETSDGWRNYPVHLNLIAAPQYDGKVVEFEVWFPEAKPAFNTSIKSFEWLVDENKDEYYTLINEAVVSFKELPQPIKDWCNGKRR